MDIDSIPEVVLWDICASIFTENSYEKWSKFWHLWRQIKAEIRGIREISLLLAAITYHSGVLKMHRHKDVMSACISGSVIHMSFSR